MLDDYTNTSKKYTYIQEILDVIKGNIDCMIEQHCKVLLVRFDLRFPLGTIHHDRNDEISDFIKALTNHYNDRGIASRYIWVREHWNSDAPHYHIAFLLNGSLVQNPMGVWAKAAEIWSKLTNGPRALVHQCRAKPMGRDFAGGIMIRRPSGIAVGPELFEQHQAFQATYDAALSWTSYLAKDFSKDNTPYRVRRYGASRL